MTGKVFDETSNIYQDQARVLFDYYKNAAEKIVSEEMAAEQQRADLISQIEQANRDMESGNGKVPIFFAITGVCAVISVLLLIFTGPFCVVGIAGAIFCLVKALGEKKGVKDAEARRNNCINEMQALKAKYDSIRRDYAVEKIGVAYVPVATRVPFEDKSFLIDHTHTVDNTNFHLTLLRNPEEFQDSINSLQNAMEKMPIVETNQNPESIDTSDYSVSIQNVTLNDYIGNIDRQVRNISYLLNDNDQVSVEIPAIDPRSSEADFIGQHATNDTGNKPVVEVFNTAFEDKLDKFTSLNSSKNQFDSAADSDDSTDYLKKLVSQMAESVSILSKTKNAGSSSLMQYASEIMSTVLKSGFNQYSPLLEKEEIERIRETSFDYKTEVNSYEPFHLKKSSEVKFDLFSNNWVAEDGSRTPRPFGMHQVDEEVLQPIIAALMEENRTERLHVYNSIEDQKRIYLDRWSSEVGNYYRDNRAACDELINRMRQTYSEYLTAATMYKSLQDTTNLMKESKKLEDGEVQELDAEAEMVAGFEEQARICNEKQQEFSDYMDRIQDRISEMTNDFSHIEYYEASLRDSVSHDTAVAMANILNLDNRRRKLLGVSPYLASYAELPPEPRVSEELMEHVGINLEAQAKEQLEAIERRAMQADHFEMAEEN